MDALIPITEKVCSRCKERKSIDEFYNRVGRKGQNGPQSQCKICTVARNRHMKISDAYTMSSYIKKQTDNCFEAVDLLIRIMNGGLKDAKVRDRMEAASMLINRVYGKEPQTNINLDISESKLSEIETESLVNFLKNGNENK